VRNQAAAEVTQQINSIAKNAQQAVSLILSNSILGRLGGLIVNIAGSIGTVSRASVNTAVVNVINNPKVLPPDFKPIEREVGNVERIDISSIQRDARNRAFSRAIAAGATEEEADTIANEVGNQAGVDAFRNL